jgi:L-alanine-DL-glutamate epimerase-like enolase superfamily enzyme
MGREKLASIVTNSGIEGNYTLADHYWHSNWSNLGWLEYAKRLLKGKSALDLPAITSQWEPEARRVGQSGYAAAIDCCLWDILGKAVGLPVYRLLGAYKDKVLAYASSQHLKTVEEYIPDVMRAKSQGFKAYKIHPGPGQRASGSRIPAYVGHMEEIKTIRKAVGDDFTLLHDPVGVYNREEAIKVGRLLDQLGYVAYEDPIPTKDIEGLVDLTRALDLPIHIGEFIVSPYDFAVYVRRGAMDVVRFIVDYVGGITGGVKIARMAECFGMECAPHNWGGPLEHAVHFHIELASPNCYWFELTQPQGNSDRPYIKDQIRIDDEGYVRAPTKPGLGYEIDRAALDKLTTRIDR